MERTSIPARVTVTGTVTAEEPMSASREADTPKSLDAPAAEEETGITVSPLVTATLSMATKFTVKELMDSAIAKEIVIPTASALKVLCAYRETDTLESGDAMAEDVKTGTTVSSLMPKPTTTKLSVPPFTEKRCTPSNLRKPEPPLLSRPNVLEKLRLKLLKSLSLRNALLNAREEKCSPSREEELSDSRDSMPKERLITPVDATSEEAPTVAARSVERDKEMVVVKDALRLSRLLTRSLLSRR